MWFDDVVVSIVVSARSAMALQGGCCVRAELLFRYISDESLARRF